MEEKKRRDSEKMKKAVYLEMEVLWKNDVKNANEKEKLTEMKKEEMNHVYYYGKKKGNEEYNFLKMEENTQEIKATYLETEML
jgi:hypothetical protein